MITVAPIPADFDDWQLLLAMIMSSFASMDGVIDPPSSAHQLTPRLLQQKAEREIVHLARDDGQLVGGVFCRPEAPDFLYIGKLAVLPAAQGKGVGRMLLKAAEQDAARLRLPALRLETRIELVRNHATFAAWGFKRTAEKSHPGYTRITFIEMQKPISG